MVTRDIYASPTRHKDKQSFDPQPYTNIDDVVHFYYLPTVLLISVYEKKIVNSHLISFHFANWLYNNNEKKNNKPFIAHIKILLLFIVTAQRMHKKQTLSLIASISASHGCNIKKKYKNIESVRKKTLNVTPATAVEQVALWLGLIIYYNSRKKNSSTRDLSE